MYIIISTFLSRSSSLGEVFVILELLDTYLDVPPSYDEEVDLEDCSATDYVIVGCQEVHLFGNPYLELDDEIYGQLDYKIS